MTAFASQYLYVICQIGAEKALKEELARNHPALKFAFSRPGFITFKHGEKPDAITPDFELHSVLAREYGMSLSRVESDHKNEVIKIIEDIKPDQIFIFERDQFKVGEEPPQFQIGALASEALNALRDVVKPKPVKNGDLVLSVCVLDPGKWFLGLHRHNLSHTRWPGGRPAIKLPPEAPSRAYLKCNEAIEWSGYPLRRDQLALEIGSAPGGATYALLERGLYVVGIDPGEMHPSLLQKWPDRFKYIHRLAEEVDLSRLSDVDWLFMDMNIPPDRAIYLAEPYIEHFRDTLKGIIFTLKLNDWAYVSYLDELEQQIARMGFRNIRMRQLAFNKQELCLVAAL